jgi:hypothetical protein
MAIGFGGVTLVIPHPARLNAILIAAADLVIMAILCSPQMVHSRATRAFHLAISTVSFAKVIRVFCAIEIMAASFFSIIADIVTHPYIGRAFLVAGTMFKIRDIAIV